MGIVVRESVYRSVVKAFRVVGFVVGVLVLAIGLTIWYAMPESGFGPENIARVNQSIRDYYSQKNLQVAEINLIRENKQKLSGYIVVRVPGLAEPVQKTCTATMDDQSEKFVWSCGG
ncbi:hypothetical protein M2171_004738 [Bradyrhizobium japonicum USDA 38]|uniref:hypothetical protein n=1 Tax=Bradyrhizobium japonicum TaxID=375 RepID=UPI00047F45FA|nr:hypothetical protein [Bradyrhizobium japonicum]MCS3895605.1 hypothetical protein [Bradyrhizobium japonicum USDA 38]MCS3948120.1 hypothetical protein [Bradyrhizobium japonicum]